MRKILRKIWRLICSRYVICSLLIIVELFILISTEKYLIEWLMSVRIVSYIISFLTLLYVINTDMSVEGKLPWIVIILLIQPFGALLYAIFGGRLITRHEKKFFKDLEIDYGKLLDIEETTLNELKRIDQRAYQNAYALSKESSATLYKYSTSKYFSTGELFYESLLSSLKEAKHFIFMEYFIICEGKMWDSILEILVEKVNEGVEVRFMYDDIGSLFNVQGNYYKKLCDLGIKAKCFAKYTYKANSSHNNRNHRKITVIDGEIAYTGGINLADEYINEKVIHGHWKDSAIQITGEAVKELTKIFLYDWDLNSGEVSAWNKYLIYQKQEIEDGYYLPFGTGPKPLYAANIAKNTYLNLINQATNYVYITTPYLIIDKELTNALMNAAKRGVDVKLILPHIPDKKYVYVMGKNAYIPLIKSGVKIYEYTKGFIHAKNFICDDIYAICGTINLDYRSLLHHYENAVWMYKTKVLFDMKQDFNNTIEESMICTIESSKQNFITRLFVSVIHLFAPFF